MSFHGFPAAGTVGSKITLACFPHAGGGAGRFRRWSNVLAGLLVAPIALPGREERFGEPPLTSVHDIAALVLAEQPFLAEADAPVALAGISFGALLAFEIACRLHERGAPPMALFLASQRAAYAPSVERAWYKLPDALLLEEIMALGGIEQELAADPEFVEIFLGVIRADLQASETYSAPAGPRLSCPFFIYRGISDPAVTDDDVEAWRNETTGHISIRRLAAGHFLMAGPDDLWLDSLRKDIATIRPTPAVPLTEAHS